MNSRLIPIRSRQKKYTHLVSCIFILTILLLWIYFAHSFIKMPVHINYLHNYLWTHTHNVSRFALIESPYDEHELVASKYEKSVQFRKKYFPCYFFNEFLLYTFVQSNSAKIFLSYLI